MSTTNVFPTLAGWVRIIVATLPKVASDPVRLALVAGFFHGITRGSIARHAGRIGAAGLEGVTKALSVDDLAKVGTYGRSDGSAKRKPLNNQRAGIALNVDKVMQAARAGKTSNGRGGFDVLRCDAARCTVQPIPSVAKVNRLHVTGFIDTTRA